MTRKLLYSPDYHITFNPRSLYSYSITDLVNAGKELVDRMAMRRNEWRDWLGPHHAGKGLAKQMVQEVIRIAQEKEIKTIRLDVLEGNIPAERAYTKIGFAYLDTLRMFYEDTGWTAYKLFEYII